MDATLESVAALLSTLADPNRLAIIRGLTLRCESVSAIVERTGLSQPLVSHHLRVLRERGLARTERRGLYTYYWLSDIAVWETVEKCSELAQRLQIDVRLQLATPAGPER